MTHALAARRHSPFYLYLATGAVKRQWEKGRFACEAEGEWQVRYKGLQQNSVFLLGPDHCKFPSQCGAHFGRPRPYYLIISLKLYRNY